MRSIVGSHRVLAALVVAGLAWASADPACHAAAAAAPVPAASSSGASSHELVQGLDVPATRDASREAILRLGADAVALLEPRESSPSFTIRWEIANICGLLGEADCAPVLTRLVLGDPSPHVRWRASWALKALSAAARAEATSALRAAVAEGGEPRAWNAAVCLASLGDGSALELLHAGLARPDAWQRWEAVNALGRVHDARTADALAPIVRAGAEKERKEAMLTLGLVADARSLALLREALEDPSPEVRWRACQSLGRARDAGSAEALGGLARSDGSPAVRAHAARALAALGRALPSQEPAEESREAATGP